MRYNRNAKFVEAFFSVPGFRPTAPAGGMETVNLAGTVPGWTRFTPAQGSIAIASRPQPTSALRPVPRRANSKRSDGPWTGNVFRGNSEWVHARTEAQREGARAITARPSEDWRCAELQAAHRPLVGAKLAGALVPALGRRSVGLEPPAT